MIPAFSAGPPFVTDWTNMPSVSRFVPVGAIMRPSTLRSAPVNEKTPSRRSFFMTSDPFSGVTRTVRACEPESTRNSSDSPSFAFCTSRCSRRSSTPA